MNPTSIQLALLGSRRSWGRPLGIIFGIAVGIVLFLTLWGAASGLEKRDTRTAWQNIYIIFSNESVAAFDSNHAILADSTDYFRNVRIDRRDIAVTSDTNLTMPWDAPFPKPGEYYASPALARLIAHEPAEQLGDRYGVLLGVIPDSVLAGPQSLVAIVGESESHIRNADSAVVVDDLSGNRTQDNTVYRTIIIIGGISMFLPVLIFVAIVTELGAVQRMERLATLRLIGAGPRSVVSIAMIEMAILSAAGSVLGIIAWWLLRPVGAAFSIDGTRFFTGDLSVSPRTIVLAVALTVLGATLTAGWRISRAGIGPLGAIREHMERAPSFLRLFPVAAGFGLTALATTAWRRGFLDYRVSQLLLLVGFTLTGFGIVVAGPWLTAMCSRITMRYAKSAAGVIAASRIRRHPAATFRAMSGLVLTIFIVSVFAGSATSVLDTDQPAHQPGTLALSSIFVMLTPGTVVPEADLDTLRALPGVTAATIALSNEEYGFDLSIPYADASALGLVTVAGSGWIKTNQDIIYATDRNPMSTVAQEIAKPIGPVPIVLLVATDGSAAAIDRARTTMDTFSWSYSSVLTRHELADLKSQDLAHSFSTLSYIGILVTILIASIALTVATAAAILERRRIFGLLRLMGMPTGTMQRIVAFEAVVPLVAVVLFSAGLGWAIAWLIVEGLSQTRSIHMPDMRYFGTIVLGLALAAGSVLVTARLVQQNTTVSQTRFE